MEKSFVSWSGGKDCCQAAYKAIQQGSAIMYLLNMVSHDQQRSCNHGVAAQWIRAQSDAMGIPVIQYATTSDTYEAVFAESLRSLKKEGISSGVFGDIGFESHREWIKNMCSPAGITPVLPLWGGDENKIARDFIGLGFESVVITTQADLLGKEWLGRKFDEKFLKDLAEFNPKISPCGEAGEFHTLVIDGPLFEKRIDIREAEIVKHDNYWFWDIKRIELAEKHPGRNP